MFETNKDGTFNWRTDGESAAFPLDYSQSEIIKLWNLKKQFTNNYIFKNDLFCDFFMSMLFVDGKKGQEQFLKSIPSEAEPYFKRYIDYVKNAGIIFDGVTSECIYRFCQELHTEAINLEISDKDNTTPSEQPASSSDKPDARYWYRRLYENKDFQKAILNEYWEKEYVTRRALVEQLFIQLPIDVQINTLKKELSYLDAQIASMTLILQKEGNASTNLENLMQPYGSNDFTHFAHGFPTELVNSIRKRGTINSRSSNRVVYSVQDHPVTICNPETGCNETKMLSYYFNRINSKFSAEKKQAVREAYLRDVCQIPAQSYFQKECLSLHSFLNSYVDKEITEDQIKKRIADTSKEYFRSIFFFHPIIPGLVHPNDTWKYGANRLVDELICNLYTTFFSNFALEIDALCYWNILTFTESDMRHVPLSQAALDEKKRMYYSYLAALRNLQPRVNSLTFTSLNDYCNMITHLYDPVIANGISITDGPLPDESIDKLSTDLEKKCIEAYAFMEERKPEWMNSDHFHSSWKRYSDLRFGNSSFEKPFTANESDVHLCTALLMCKTHRECLQAIATTYDSYYALLKFLDSRQ